MHLSTLTQASARVIARVVAPQLPRSWRGSWLGGRAVGALPFFTEARAAGVGAAEAAASGAGRTGRGERVEPRIGETVFAARREVFVIQTPVIPGASIAEALIPGAST